MIIINLTPHDVIIRQTGKVVETYEASGLIASVVYDQKHIYTIDAYGNEIRVGRVVVTDTNSGFVDDMPDPIDEIIYIVSEEVFGQYDDRDRFDLVTPIHKPVGI